MGMMTKFKAYVSKQETSEFTDKAKSKLRFHLMGRKFTDGLIYKVFLYVLLISLSYIYLYPMLFMVANSFMTSSDIISASVRWIPSALNWENYRIVWQGVNYPRALWNAFVLAAMPAVAATVSSAFIGYGFAKYNFPFKRTLMVLLLVTFIIPPQITMWPTFRMFANYQLLGTVRAFIYPAILGQGLNGAIYILIFYSFFKMIPKVLEESAQLDGATPLQVFMKIAIPLAVPAIIIVFLFSFVWYYNETLLSGIYLADQWVIAAETPGAGYLPLPLRISQYINAVDNFPVGSPAYELSQAIRLAGNVLTILPLLILYFFTQRYFVESIDKTGITGE